MKISNNIPIIEHKDVINTFTKNLKKKRKEKGFTQRQLADILDVTLKTYRSLSAILKSLDELQIYMSNLNVEKYRAKFYDLKATFLETENIPNKKAPNTN